MAVRSDPAIRRNASPWEGTLTLYPFVNVPRSARAQRSRTVALPVASPISLQVTVIVVVAVPRFRSPTARTPDPERGLYQTCEPAPLSLARMAWNDRGSWSTAMTSGLVRSEEHTSELQSPCNLVCRL